MYLDFDINAFLKDNEYIINIDSPSNYPAGIEKVADFFHEGFKDLGWNSDKIFLDEKAGPCLKVTNTNSEEFDILIVGHMDTVFDIGTTEKRPMTIDGNKVFGPGVCDMKTNILINYYALKEISKLEKQPNICVFYNSDEEISSRYSKEIIMELAKKSKFAVVLEGARLNGDLVAKRKGVSRYAFEVKGRAAHSGTDHINGLSSIEELANIIKELHKLTDYEKGTTVNVGVVSGGSKANIVADYAQGEVDIRFEDNSEYEKINEAIEAIIRNSQAKGYEVIFSQKGWRPPMNPTEKTKKLFKYIEELGREINMSFGWASTGGGSDANFTAHVGTPSVDGFGPRSANPHREDEYIEMDSIEPMLNLLYKTIKNANNIIF